MVRPPGLAVKSMPGSPQRQFALPQQLTLLPAAIATVTVSVCQNFRPETTATPNFNFISHATIP